MSEERKLPEVHVKDTYKSQRQGKTFIAYAGMVDAGYEIVASITTQLLRFEMDEDGEPVYAIVSAELRTFDGRVFSGLGDATRGNVGRMIAPHIIRMAETRAKARAYRDALNITEAAIEELGGEEEAPPRQVSKLQTSGLDNQTFSRIRKLSTEVYGENGFNHLQQEVIKRKINDVSAEGAQKIIKGLEKKLEELKKTEDEDVDFSEEDIDLDNIPGVAKGGAKS